MQEANEISVELSALSALVSGIGRQTPYRVPAGYFDRFPTILIDRILHPPTLEGVQPTAFEGVQSPSLEGVQPPTFQVPEGYFEGLAAQVLARIRTEEELPPIFSRITRINPYRIPEGYFEELSPLLAILRDKPAYAIPEGYFDDLSPVLTVAHDRTTYRVPEAYFAGLPERILEKVVEPVATAKVISLERGRSGNVLKGHWWYASAAAIAACFLLIFSWPQADRKGIGKKTGGVEMALQKVSDQEMQAYLDDQHTILTEPVSNTTATLDMNEGEVKSLLGEVPDNDLQQYMEEHGKVEDLATN